jgi:hypothetical protein
MVVLWPRDMLRRDRRVPEQPLLVPVGLGRVSTTHAPLVPLGLRRLWAGEVILDVWCERAGIPSGTTIDQLDGRTVIPEHPEALARFVQGRALGPSAAATVLVPLDEWPKGLRIHEVLPGQLARWVTRLGLDADPALAIKLTIGELLVLPGFGPTSVVRFGCAVEAGVVEFLSRKVRNPPEVSPVPPQHVRRVSMDISSITNADEDTSVPALVRRDFHVEVTCSYPRFEEPGWALQGITDICCGDCNSEGPFVVYRKPYSTARGIYRYWAIVCLTCKTVDALDDFQKADKKSFRAWESGQALEELALTPSEEPESSTAEVSHQPSVLLAPSEASAPTPLATPAPSAPTVDQPVAQRPATTPSAVVDEAAISAARAELAASSEQIRQLDVGRAVRDDSQSPPVYRVLAPSLDLSEQPPGEVFLAAHPGDGQRFNSRVRFASSTEALVLPSDDPPAEIELHLYLQIDPSLVARAFATYLETCKEPRLAPLLAGRGRLSRGPAEPFPGLNEEQQSAAGAIMSPGVSVVWGPPGTGKTRVIGAAVAELLRRGRSVALVSNTNVAVDQALLHVSRAAEPFEPGRILRVGHPSIPEVSEHPTLLVSKAVRVKFRPLILELERLQSELPTVRAHAEAAEADRLDVLVSGHTASSLDDLVLRRDLLHRRVEIAQQSGVVAMQLAEQRILREEAGNRFTTALTVSQRWKEFANLLEDEREVASLERSIRSSDSGLAELDRRNRESSTIGRLKRRRLLRDIEDARASIETVKRQATERLSTHLRNLEEGLRLGATPAQIRSAQNEETAAEAEWRYTKDRVTESEAKLRDLEAAADRLSGVSDLAPLEIRTLEQIEQFGSSQALLTEAERRRAIVDKIAGRLRELSSKIEDIQRKLQDQETVVVAEAKVVGTTLAQLVLHRGLLARTFDHVLIDEASAALPPYVYAAMTKAELGCTLVGDFEQNWPISRCKSSTLPPDLAPWLLSNPFALLGITSAASAAASPGCVVLRDQFRFGDKTMQLANRIAYGGLLRHGRGGAGVQVEHPELVIIDTSGLIGAAAKEKGPNDSGRWWAAGAALSLELAKTHAFAGVGVVTPYRHQAQLTRAMLNDNGGQAVQVGTAHSFQGREFPVVVIDLVEDGTGSSWVARADRTGSAWERDGVRLFNVAVTRNAGRLYVISNAGSIRSARSGPLRELGMMLSAGEAEVWDARSVLGEAWATSISEVRNGTDAQLSTPQILDDTSFYESLNRDLESAVERVVIFSPFVASRRLDVLLPALRKLIERGVKVAALTKASAELQNPGLLVTLRAAGVNVTERRGMHEKVVIVDQHVTYVGSLNTLSNTGLTDEIMLRLDGHRTNRQITQWLRLAARKRG